MTAATPRDDQRDVALVGIGCRFPGGVVDVSSFWAFLCAGRNAIGDIPPDRMDTAAFFDPAPGAPGKMMVNRGGYLERIDEFDAAFFGISPREADVLDPQQRLLLETAWEALEDAGQDVAKLAGSRTGVFVGQWTSDFEARLFAHPEEIDFYGVQGSGRYASSGRISYALGLRGPSLTLDTACSSALVAVHLAARSIRSGECEIALAAAANIILQPHVSIAYSQARMLAADGQCKFGDASGDGYVRSEGAAVLVLKSLARARAEGDHVYAIIRGSAVGNDGASSGSMGTPSQTSQEDVLHVAYEDAGLPAWRVGYVEAHGTGTRAGDPVELKAIAAVAGGSRRADRPLFVGSAKTNWGHTEAAAGLAGLIKAALVLHHGRIPPSLHRSQPNPLLTPAELALIIPGETIAFPLGENPGVAGVTALGISGTNAHVVLEEARVAPAPERDPFEQWKPAVVLPLSARSPWALRRMATLVADQLESDSAPDVGDVCWTAARRRTTLSHRAAFVAESRTALIEGLRGFAEDDETVPAVFGTTAPKIGFVCPGQGAQSAGMARELMRRHPAFLAALTECDQAASPYTDYSLIAQLEADPDRDVYRLDEISVIQPVLVALAIAYARLLAEFGVVPAAVVGHSMGEVAAACIAGVIDIDRAMRIVCRRSALMQRTSGRGAMAVVDLPMGEAAKRLAGWEDRVNVAVSNSPRSCVISGDPEAVRQLMSEFERDGVFCRAVKVDVASHSPQMERPAATLASELAGMAADDACVPIWSTVLGERAHGGDFGAAYWGRNLREPVRFADAVDGMLKADISIFVELGPHPVLLHAIEQTARARGERATTIACGRREAGESSAFLSALGRLWAAGHPLAWDRVLPSPGRFVSLPLYPWQREKHWAVNANRISAGSARQAPESPRDEEALSWLYAQAWKRSDPPRLWVVPPAARFLLIGPEGDARTSWRETFAAVGADAVAASVDDLERAVAASSADGLGGVLVLTPDGPEAPYLPIRVLQAVLKSDWRVRPRIWIVTRGAQAVHPNGSERLSIDHAAAWGASRVVGEEHPDIWGGLVDLDPKAPPTGDAALVVHHVFAGDGEDQVAIRGARRFALRLVPATLDGSAKAFGARRDAAYLITGGFGDMGLHLARVMAQRGARRLILLGRSEMPPRNLWSAVDPDAPVGRRITAVRALEADGVAIHLAAVDVGDAAALREFLDRYNSEAWPPICGVIHAVGAVDDCLCDAIGQARFDALLGPKLRGAQHLDRLLPQLDFFALMSSMAAFMPQSGQASYAAANAGLDALAQDRRSRGLPAVSINWGAWEDTGLMRGSRGALQLVELGRQGIRSMTPARGVGMFCRVCQSEEPVLAVLPIDWAVFEQARHGRGRPIFSENFAAALSVDAARSPATPGINASRTAGDLDQIVYKAVGSVLKISVSRLDPRKPLGAMGLTSLMAIELRNLLETSLTRPLSATLAWNHPTIEALIGFLGSDPSRGTTAPIPDNASTGTYDGPDLAALSDLSDEAALAALRNSSVAE
jgi:phthiocerol/phenolphthiocerol synthesis type-I polyketide synthase B